MTVEKMIKDLKALVKKYPNLKKAEVVYSVTGCNRIDILRFEPSAGVILDGDEFSHVEANDIPSLDNPIVCIN